MGIVIKTGFDSMRLDDVMALFQQTYWANRRTRELVERSMRASLCYGAFDAESGTQIGFARVVTDGCTIYYLCDVIVDERYRGRGAARALLDTLTNDERIKGLRGLLFTRDAFGLYRKYGFECTERAMMCEPF